MSRQMWVAQSVEAARLRAKRKGYPTRLGGWLRLAWAMPCILLVLMLKGIGIEIMLYPDHFGHQAIDVEYFLRTRKKRLNKPVYLCGNYVPNTFLFEKHRLLVHMVRLPAKAIQYVRAADKLCIRVWGRSLFHSVSLDHQMLDAETWGKLPPTLRFTEEEKLKGQELFRMLGLQPQQYVCFHCRQGAYALKSYGEMIKDRSGEAGDVEAQVALFEKTWFQQFRNSQFSDYHLAFERLMPHGLTAVRIGAIVEGDITGANNVVDYSGQHRAGLGKDADFADVWLMANARFYVGTSSGVTAFAYIFNRPIVWVNSFPWPWGGAPASAGSIYIPKLISKNSRTLSFAELAGLSAQQDWRTFYDNAEIERLGWFANDNSPEEIAEVVEEMALRLESQWLPDTEDEARQQELLALFQPGTPMHGTSARMGRAFLEKNRELLEPQKDDIGS